MIWMDSLHLAASGRYELLGPAIAQNTLGNGTLCLDPTTLLPGKQGVSYTVASFTRAAVTAAQALRRE
jgi:hypothetical protein